MLVLMIRHRSIDLAFAKIVRAVLVCLLVGILAATAQAQSASYQGPLLPDPNLFALQARPVWRDRLDSPTAVVTDSAVVYLRDGRLVATELAGGWQQWSYGSGLTGPILLASDMVLLAEGDRVTALDAGDGTPRWSTEVTERQLRFMDVSGPTLIVGSGAESYTALDLASGRTVHTFDVPGVSSPAYVDDQLAIFSAHHGEPNVHYYHAFDAATGAESWSGRGWVRLLAVEEGRAYFLNQQSATADPHPARFSVSVVDSLTGIRVGHWQYDFAGELAAWSPTDDVTVVLTAEAVFASNLFGTQVFRFPLGGSSEPTGLYQVPGGGEFRAGPHLGLLFFEAHDHSLVATSLTDATTTEYLFAGTQLSRLDLIGTRAYAGRTDGTLLAVDLGNARIRYLLRAGGTGFGPTLSAGAYAVVQSTTELLVLEALE